MNSTQTFYHYKHTPLYILGFILFWEWLRPLEIVTDTANSIYFVVFVALCFLFYFLKLPFWLSAPLRLAIILSILHVLFFDGSIFNGGWLRRFYDDIVNNAQNISESKWWAMSDLFRSFLFLLLLWLMSYLIHYWLIQAKRLFAFFLLTIAYLAILDTFTAYSANQAIVRTVIIGFVILGSLQVFRLKETENIKIRSHWVIILLVMIALSIGIGFKAPKAGPQWPDPVPFIKSVAEGEYKASVSKVGYGVDDSRLGGPFVDDNTVVFTAEVNKGHYWRVESKDFYTGKGWLVSKEIPKSVIDQNDIDLNLFENIDKEEKATEQITISNIGPYPHIAYPVDLSSIETEGNNELVVEPFTGKLSFEQDGRLVSLQTYKVIYEYPVFSIDALKRANDGDNATIQEIYTQLPSELPQRISSLAVTITADKATRYEKAKAIESYFSRNDFVYEREDVAIPNEDEDYVDQFLFETKKGYCDNFSSSMVVLLRTLDIPARWVKGYTDGDYVKTLESGKKLYEIKNSNAHSWVEVYFPGIGWVPFEPTIGFENLYSFSENAVPALAEEEQPEQPIIGPIADEGEKKEIENEDQLEVEREFNFDIINKSIKVILIFIGLAGLIVGLMFKFKGNWYPYWILFQYRINKEQKGPNASFETLLLLLRSKGMVIQNGETLREYAIRVDQNLGTSEMEKITSIYETLLYSNKDEVEELETRKELLENLIKKIIS